VLDVWLERGVYDKEFISRLRKRLLDKSVFEPTTPPDPPETSTNSNAQSPTSIGSSPANVVNLIATGVANDSTVYRSEQEIEQIIAQFEPKKLCELLSTFQTQMNELNVCKASVEASRLADISVENIKQYRGE
jgi:hypothetical protein